MRKYISSLALAAISLVTLASVPAHAQEVKPQVVVSPAMVTSKEPPLTAQTVTGPLYLSDYLPATPAPTHLSAVTANAIQPQSPAPTLSYINTQYTCSQATSTAGIVCENDSAVYTTTATYPRTLYKIYEVIEEHGYATGLLVRLGGSGGTIVPSSSMVERDNLCGSNYSTSCPVGSIITGWRYWYDLTSMLYANYPRSFYAQDTGINNGPTLNTAVTIQ